MWAFNFCIWMFSFFIISCRGYNVYVYIVPVQIYIWCSFKLNCSHLDLDLINFHNLQIPEKFHLPLPPTSVIVLESRSGWMLFHRLFYELSWGIGFIKLHFHKAFRRWKKKKNFFPTIKPSRLIKNLGTYIYTHTHIYTYTIRDRESKTI